MLNSSETTEVKFRTIDLYGGVSVLRGLITSLWSHKCFQIPFLDGEKRFVAEIKASTRLINSKKFYAIGTRMTSSSTTNRKVCFLHFLKKY